MGNYAQSNHSTLNEKGSRLDPDWLCLIIQAKKLGISKNEVREFLETELLHSR